MYGPCHSLVSLMTNTTKIGEKIYKQILVMNKNEVIHK